MGSRLSGNRTTTRPALLVLPATINLSAAEQDELDEMSRALAGDDRDVLRVWWQERLRAARQGFNDPDHVDRAAGHRRHNRTSTPG